MYAWVLSEMVDSAGNSDVLQFSSVEEGKPIFIIPKNADARRINQRNKNRARTNVTCQVTAQLKLELT